MSMESTATEKKKTEKRSPQEKREDRRLRVLIRRHKMALAGLGFEKILSEDTDSYPVPEDKYFRLADDFNRLLIPGHKGNRVRLENFKTAIGTYLTLKNLALSEEKRLKELLSPGEKATPENLASIVFFRRVGREPKGKAVLYRKEAYFIVYFENEEDFYSFKLGKDVVSQSDIEKYDLREAVGCYYNSYMLGPDVLMADCIIVKGIPESNPAFESIVAHERQHFINNGPLELFREFEKSWLKIEEISETRLLEESSIARKMDLRGMKLNLAPIKDELLARIREGADAERCAAFLEDEAYSYLLNTTISSYVTGGEKRYEKIFSEEEELYLGRLMRKIKAALDAILPIFDNDEKRAVLVYHLIDIPLHRIPDWLKTLEDFYSRPPGDILPGPGDIRISS